MVVERLLVEVHPLRGPARIGEEQLPGQLEHVVRVAALTRGVGQFARDPVRRLEVLAVGIAPDRVRVLTHHEVPEVDRDVAIPGRAGGVESADRRDRLRDLRVRVETGQRVGVRGERVEDLGVVEILCSGQVRRVLGDLVEIEQRLPDATELGSQHLLALGVRQSAVSRLDPGRLAFQNGPRLRVPGELIHVEQPRHDLVQRVIGRPDALPALQTIKKAFRVRGQKAVRLLAERELSDQIVALGLESGVARAGIGLRERGHDVPDRMPAQFRRRRLPAAARGGRRGQPGVDPEHVQQPVGVEEPQVGLGAPGVVGERAGAEADGGERERVRRDAGVRAGERRTRQQRAGRTGGAGEQDGAPGEGGLMHGGSPFVRERDETVIHRQMSIYLGGVHPSCGWCAVVSGGRSRPPGGRFVVSSCCPAAAVTRSTLEVSVPYENLFGKVSSTLRRETHDRPIPLVAPSWPRFRPENPSRRPKPARQSIRRRPRLRARPARWEPRVLTGLSQRSTRSPRDGASTAPTRCR